MGGRANFTWFLLPKFYAWVENLGRWRLYPSLPPFFTRDGGSLQKCSLGHICEWCLVCYYILAPVCLCDYTSEFFMFPWKGNYYLLSTYYGLALYMWSLLRSLGHRGVTQDAAVESALRLVWSHPEGSLTPDPFLHNKFLRNRLCEVYMPLPILLSVADWYNG